MAAVAGRIEFLSCGRGWGEVGVGAYHDFWWVVFRLGQAQLTYVAQRHPTEPKARFSLHVRPHVTLTSEYLDRLVIPAYHV